MNSNNKSLSQIIRDADGNLVEGPESGTGTGQLQAQAEAGQVPSTPAGAAEGGANSDAAKMAGTPNQVSAAPVLPASTTAQAKPVASSLLTQSNPTRLADVLRLEQPTAQATPEQQKEQADAQRLQAQFGNLGSRIQDIIRSGSYINQAAGAGAAAGTLTGDAAKLTPEQQAALKKFVAAPGDLASLAAAKQALGGEDPNKYIQKDAADQSGKDLAAATTDMRLTPEVVSQLGYTPDQLAEQLGIPADQLAGMSIEDFQAKIDEQMRAEFSDVQQAKARAMDPALGPNERAAARAQLKELGATGVYATEADIDNLQKSVASADEVEFNGELMKVSDLMSDEHMSGLAKSYVDAAEDSPEVQNLRKNEPKLAAWLDEHKKAIQELSIQMEGTVTKFGEIQGSAQKVVDGLKQVGIDDASIPSVMKQLIPDWNPGLMTEAVDINMYPGLALLVDPLGHPPPKDFDPLRFADSFKQLAAMSPEAAAHLAQLTPEQIKKLGAADPDSSAWKQYSQYVGDWSKLQQLDATNPDSVAKFLFGDTRSFSDLQTQWDREMARGKLGGSSPWQRDMQPILDANKDGKIDAPQEIAARLKDQIAGGNYVKDPTMFPGASANALLGTSRGGPPSDTSLAGVLADKARDGRVDLSDIQNVNTSTRSSDDLSKLLNNPLLTPDAKKWLQKEVIMHKTKEGYQGTLTAVGLSKDELFQITNGAARPSNPKETLRRIVDAEAKFGKHMPDDPAALREWQKLNDQLVDARKKVWALVSAGK